MATTSNGQFVCDECGDDFEPGPDTYIGPKDRDDNCCEPFTAILGNWQELCAKCNKEK